MAFPLHLDTERIRQEFDADAFAAGQAIAPGLVGCVALARLSGNDSMKPFWLQTTPTPSETDSTASGTSASSFYADIKDIATPLRPCIILHTVMNPWHAGMETLIVPIARSSDSCLLESAGWIPINHHRSFNSVETSPPWPYLDCFVGVGHAFTLRCKVNKVCVLLGCFLHTLTCAGGICHGHV
jgi:hypothetical protein